MIMIINLIDQVLNARALVIPVSAALQSWWEKQKVRAQAPTLVCGVSFGCSERPCVRRPFGCCPFWGGPM